MTRDDLPSSFHPLIRSWFSKTYGKPTAVQAEAWPLIEAGDHVLALAPTGSGKTLTAFLACLSRFAEGTYPADKLSVLYVSPLKALNEDIRRNLREPLAAVAAEFEKAGLPFPAIRVETRSGDTPQAERRRFLLHPPSILALTPESLAILLLNPRGRLALSTVRYLILDEIHAVLGNKRGSFLSCQIDRLSLIAGEFQRISLSATIRPPEAAAEFVGGLNRRVRIAAPQAEKNIELLVDFPGPLPDDPAAGISAGETDPGSGNIPGFAAAGYGKRYGLLVDRILELIRVNHTTLVFTDSRRRAERLCFLLNQRAEKIVAYTHHGSLSKELRRAVEQRLADGTLPCVVATASLELGIDIGSVDEVILAGSPGSVSQALQRIGRSGHGVGRISRGRLFPFHGMDLLLAAALGEAVDARDIEETRPVQDPLDVLAQIILALCVEKKRTADELYELLRGFYVFRGLSRFSFDSCINMLAGYGSGGNAAIGNAAGVSSPDGNAASVSSTGDKGREKTAGPGTWKRFRELKPRLYLDRQTGEIEAAPGTLQILYSSGGVIASRGLYSLRLSDGTKIGELDEEFVWERRIGDCFDFGSRGWRILSIGPEAVEAAPLEKPVNYIPFWKADAMFRSPVLARRLLAILDRYKAGEELCPPLDPAPPEKTPGDQSWQSALNEFLDSQKRAQGAVPLAGSGLITAEIIDSGESRGDFYSAVIHSFRGGAVNYPLGLALAQYIEEKLRLRAEAYSDDNGILLLIPRFAETVPETLIRESLLALDEDGGGGICRGERLFRKRLESSGIFGASFREAAERSLLLPRAGFGKRTPLWIMRQRAKRLFDAAAGEEEFPVSAEAWRTCLRDTFDMAGFRELAGRLRDGAVALSFFRTHTPSPFSRDLVRQETNVLMYEYDERPDLRNSSRSLSDRVIEEALGEAGRRPKLSPALVENFRSRLRREIPGWAPEDETALAEWVKERIAIPLDEWEILVKALPETLRQKLAEDPGLGNRIGPLGKPAARGLPPENRKPALPVMVHRDWHEDWERETLNFLGPWLRYEGPISLSRIREVFGVTEAEAGDAADALIEAEEVVGGVQLEGTDGPGGPIHGGDNLFCDRENLDLLLRLARKKHRPAVKERPAALLVPFLALRQGLAGTGPAGGNAAPWKVLACFTAPVKLWETEFFPARSPGYGPEILDREIRDGKLLWYGRGRERGGFCSPEDTELVLPEDRGEGPPGLEAGFFDRPRDFWAIKEALGAASPGVDNGACAEILWREVWQARLSADSWEPVRRGIEGGFAYRETARTQDINAREEPVPRGYGRIRRHIPRALREKWRTGAPVGGTWFSIVPDYEGPPDLLDDEELNRDRVRLLLERWGVLCRPLLEREALFTAENNPLSWSRLLPCMRRMELAGELAAGRFFSGINSLQFASPRIITELEEAEKFGGLYWMNAADPASPAGLNIDGLDPRFPARTAASRLCFRGQELIAVSGRGGKDLAVFIPPDDPALEELAAFSGIPRRRTVHPEKKLVIEKINGKPAAQSRYAAAFTSAGFISDQGKLYLW
ncbi:MAG: DEAD/DEAH box helicase [Treponema sp.]|jgi:ATP-dependent Lhr-like helicase|nr:DEAD/DEAH box helicase [Treponema sp.]